MARKQISFEISDADAKRVSRIVTRTRALLKAQGVTPRPAMDIRMDLVATHASGCPMDFVKLEAADDFNLMHDISGIANCLNRTTGKLMNHFLPRCAARERIAA